MQKNTFFFKKVCVYEKNVVSLHRIQKCTLKNYEQGT